MEVLQDDDTPGVPVSTGSGDSHYLSLMRRRFPAMIRGCRGLRRYVERNPVRAGLVERPWRYEWSSAARHAGGAEADPLPGGDAWFDKLAGGWREFLPAPEEEEFLGRVRREFRRAGRSAATAS